MTTPRNDGRVSAADAAIGWLDTIREYSDIKEYVRASLGSGRRNSELRTLHRVVFGDVTSRGPSGSDLGLERERTWADALFRRALVLQIELDAETLLLTGNDNPIWPHRDDQIWPHPMVVISSAWALLSSSG